MSLQFSTVFSFSFSFFYCFLVRLLQVTSLIKTYLLPFFLTASKSFCLCIKSQSIPIVFSWFNFFHISKLLINANFCVITPLVDVN